MKIITYFDGKLHVEINDRFITNQMINLKIICYISDYVILCEL